MSMRDATRRQLLGLRSSSAFCGRWLFVAQAQVELTRRATVQHVYVGCSMARVERVIGLVVGRRKKVLLLLEWTPSERARFYAAELDELANMYYAMQAARAAAAMNEVIENAR